MPKRHKPRKGSLQFWPHVRAKKILPSVNWSNLYGGIKESKKLLGFFCYKVGMIRLLVRDLTPYSMTKNKEIVLPATVLECPTLKIFSIRPYKSGKVASEVIVSNDKELKRIMKLPKQVDLKKLDDIERNIDSYNDIRLVVYSNVKKTSIKKTPDIAEIAISGSLREKFEFAKNLIGKEMSVIDAFSSGQIVDLHAITKGKGLQGPLKRFGIGKRQHKSEKGVRRPGTLGPWTPSRVTFHAPQAGQTGFFTRINYNSKIIEVGTDSTKINPTAGFHKYGLVKSPYLIVKGSVSGPVKRAVFLTIASKPSKKIVKETFEIIKILR